VTDLKAQPGLSQVSSATVTSDPAWQSSTADSEHRQESSESSGVFTTEVVISIIIMVGCVIMCCGCMMFICMYRYVWGERTVLVDRHLVPHYSPRGGTNEHHAGIGIASVGIPMHNLGSGVGPFPGIPGLQPPYQPRDGDGNNFAEGFPFAGEMDAAFPGPKR